MAGIWNAATLYKGSRLWAILARITVILGAFEFVSIVIFLLTALLSSNNVDVLTSAFFICIVTIFVPYLLLDFSSSMEKKIRYKRGVIVTCIALGAIVCLGETIKMTNRSEDDGQIEQLIDELKEKNRLFATIFRIHPEAANELKIEYQKLVSDRSYRNKKKMYTTLIPALNDLTTRYLKKHILIAPDASIHRMIKKEAEIIRSLKDSPAACIDFFFGEGFFDSSKLSKSLIEELINVRADVIESSINEPTIPRFNNDSTDAVLDKFAALYSIKDYNLGGFNKMLGLDKAGEARTLPAKESCEIAIEYLDVLASLNERESAYMYKNVHLLANTR